MLIRSMRIDEVIVYRKGIGYFLMLLQAIQDQNFYSTLTDYLFGKTEKNEVDYSVLYMAFRIFTNIRNYKKFIKKNFARAIEIFYEIIKFNVNPELFQENIESEKEKKPKSSDEIAADVLDVFIAGGYFWELDYILENIDFYTFSQIRKKINARIVSNYKMMLTIQHDPQQAIKALNETEGIEITSWADLKAKRGK